MSEVKEYFISKSLQRTSGLLSSLPPMEVAGKISEVILNFQLLKRKLIQKGKWASRLSALHDAISGIRSMKDEKLLLTKYIRAN